MSQLSGVVKQIDVCTGKWKEFKASLQQWCEKIEQGHFQSAPSLRHQLSLIQTFSNALELNEKAAIQKLRIKMDQVDPVTGEKRFGKQSQEKFQHVCDLFDTMLADMQFTLPHSEDVCMKAEAQMKDVELQKALEAKNLDLVQQEERRVAEELVRQALQQKEQEELERRKKEEEEKLILHEKAESIRKRKAEEMLNLKAFEDQVCGIYSELGRL